MTDSKNHLVQKDRLDIRDGRIFYRLRNQDGVSFTTMSVKDTPDMRRFVSWVQIHD